MKYLGVARDRRGGSDPERSGGRGNPAAALLLPGVSPLRVELNGRVDRVDHGPEPEARSALVVTATPGRLRAHAARQAADQGGAGAAGWLRDAAAPASPRSARNRARSA